MKRNTRTSIGRVKARSLIVALVVTIAALNVQAQIQGGAQEPRGTQGAVASAETPAGLPFTGLDLTLMLGGGLVLVASGMAMGRLAIRGNRV